MGERIAGANLRSSVRVLRKPAMQTWTRKKGRECEWWCAPLSPTSCPLSANSGVYGWLPSRSLRSPSGPASFVRLSRAAREPPRAGSYTESSGFVHLFRESWGQKSAELSCISEKQKAEVAEGRRTNSCSEQSLDGNERMRRAQVPSCTRHDRVRFRGETSGEMTRKHRHATVSEKRRGMA